MGQIARVRSSGFCTYFDFLFFVAIISLITVFPTGMFNIISTVLKL